MSTEVDVTVLTSQMMDDFAYGDYREGSGLETVMGEESDYHDYLDFVEGSGLELLRNMGKILNQG